MAEASKQQEPTDAVKRQQRQALIDQAAKDKDKVEADDKARKAGGSGMISTAPAPEDRKLVPADPQRFQGAEFKRAQYILDASEGTRPEDLAQPAYWVHLGEKLRPWAEIMVRANDGLWYARLIVLEAGRNWAKVHIEQVEHLSTAEVAITQADAMSPYEVKYRGPHNQWSVIRKADAAVVHEGSPTIDGAVAWLKGRLQADR